MLTRKFRHFRTALALSASLLAGAAALGTNASPAAACGGFFCSQSQPIQQDAERIVFRVNANNTISAMVNIDYSGPAHKFAWVLPVPGVPDVKVGNVRGLDAISGATAPRYTVQRTFPDSCFGGGAGAGGGGGSAGSSGSSGSAGSAGSGGGGNPVTVLKESAVGPYDYVVINVDPTLPDLSDVAMDWLSNNGYDTSALGADVLRDYLKKGMNLIAFRLQSGASTGSIRPVIMTYDGSRPMIPIRPTAVAARDNMGVLVWVVGAGRAIPVNYRDLELNEARINWFNPNSNYNDVINEAADEAGGHGFVTEASGMAGTLPNIGTQAPAQLQAIEQYRFSTEDDVQILRWVATETWRLDDGFNEVMLSEGKLPTQEALQAFVNNPNGIDPTKFPDWANFDRNKFLDAMRDSVIKPSQDTGALFASGTYTRLYTTMSASEMTEDPIFDFNMSAPPVSNFHTLQVRYQGCNTGSAWTAETDAGYYIQGIGNSWPQATQASPANARIKQAFTDKESVIIKDNTQAFPKAPSGGAGNGGSSPGVGGFFPGGSSGSAGSSGASGNNPVGAGGTAGASNSNGASNAEASGGGCSVALGNPTTGAVWIGAAAMAAWLMRRKRGKRQA